MVRIHVRISLLGYLERSGRRHNRITECCCSFAGESIAYERPKYADKSAVVTVCYVIMCKCSYFPSSERSPTLYFVHRLHSILPILFIYYYHIKVGRRSLTL